MTRRAWIRGVGAISALGDDWPTTARALATGASGIAPITRFDATGMPCAVAAEVRGAPSGGDRRIALALPAVREAWAAYRADAAAPPPERIGVFVGAESGLACFAAAHELSRAGGGGPRLDPARFWAAPEAARAWADPERTAPPAVAFAIARAIGAAGPCRTVSQACASSLAAIIEAVRALRDGACDVAVCAGVGADVDPLMTAAFGRLGALSPSGRCAPLAAGRDGFVLGEGAAALVLAADRGDAIAHLAGGARTLDGGSLTAPDPDGKGARRAIAGALADAGVPARAIGYVAAHATATPIGDAAEVAALRAVLGDDLGGARVGAVKGALGHWIAGAGALAAACAYHAVARGELLPIVGTARPADDCAVPCVLGAAARGPVEAALVDAFGFGGANACVVVAREAA